jgi:phosphate transport system permease protein
MTSTSFTGRPRRRLTRRSVRISERVARVLISIGGLGTILAVTGILVFLVWVVVPLFSSAQFDAGSRADVAGLATDTQDRRPLAIGIDEYQLVGWALRADGRLTSFRIDTGESLEDRELVPGSQLTASSFSVEGDAVSLGFADGTFRQGRIGFSTEFISGEDHPELIAKLAGGPLARDGNALVQLTPEGQLRVQRLTVEFDAPLETGGTSPIVRIDHSTRGSSGYVCALDAAGRLFVEEVERRQNLLTGEVTSTARQHQLPYSHEPARGAPAFLALGGGGDVVYLAWRDGLCRRYDARDLTDVRLAEEVDLAEGAAELTALGFLIGKSTLITGDSEGRVRGWFTTKPAGATTSDGSTLVRAHELGDGGAAVTALSASSRNRVVAVGRADGRFEVYHVTSGDRLSAARTPDESALSGIAIAPKEDGLVTLGGVHAAHWRMDLRHPEAGLTALFSPVWYEGYEKPEHVWQSSSGTDDFEPKLGLVPLIFGTLKATLYSMLFAVPIALAAAVYTSEFLSPRLRAPLKSLTEMMASLPSVVLGFLAAIVIAPFAQDVVPMLLAAVLTIPGALLFGAYLWQLLPAHYAVRFAGKTRFAAIFFALPCGALAAAIVGPLLERLLFAGDFLTWLDGQSGSRFGGWVLLGLPAAGALVLFAMSRFVNPTVRRISASWSRARCARFDLAKFVAAVVATGAVACGIALVLDGLWIDPRGAVLDTYVQRNALIVGFVMGFAVIPIVYTLAEDALSSVPSHLRLASLGAGATPWQTAVRVVIPTAMSGLFSAVMIGLGRAVGETMIVLMATGNTPVMSWNMFNGFRTLSANIAVELPEAAQNSTHYRTLFLAALCLFAMTFVFNTVAELIRQRFRKRAYQL